MRSIAPALRIAFTLLIAAVSFAAGCADSPTVPTTNTAPRTVTSSSEPTYAPGAGITLVAGDNMDRYTDAVSLGAYPYQYSGPQFSPNPAPSQTRSAVDVTHVSVIAPGRGGSGNALRLSYNGIYQESHNLAVVNVPPQPDNQAVYIQYYARIKPASNWPLNTAIAVKWLEAWHVHSQLTRVQWNMRYPSSANTRQSSPTVWQVIDQGESPTNGDQPLGPFFPQVADGNWHRFTHAFRPHTSPSMKDGFSKMWIDGRMIIDIEQGTVGVMPPGGASAWCSQADVDHLATADGVAFLNFGGPQTTTTGGWTLDIDDLLWWRQ